MISRAMPEFVQAEDPGARALRMDRTEIELLPCGEPRNWKDAYFDRTWPWQRVAPGLRVRFFTAAALVSQLEKEQKQYTLDRFLTPARPGAPADL